MIDKNAVNIKKYDFRTKFGVKALILLAKEPSLCSEALIEILVAALSYYTEGREWS